LLLAPLPKPHFQLDLPNHKKHKHISKTSLCKHNVMSSTNPTKQLSIVCQKALAQYTPMITNRITVTVSTNVDNVAQEIEQYQAFTPNI